MNTAKPRHLTLVPPYKEQPKILKVKRISVTDLARLQTAGFTVVLV